MTTQRPDSSLTRKLDRLEGYLGQDPDNATLLAETFEVALAAGASERALFHLRHAQALGLDRLDWLLREAHWLLAQQRWHDAAGHLARHEAELAASPAHAFTLAHDLAYVALREGRFADGIARLQPMLDAALPSHEIDAAGGNQRTLADPAEITWLRLLHQAGMLDRAMQWLLPREHDGLLRPRPAGVASLIALDHGDYAACLRWSDAALRADSPPPEALVARASLHLGEQQPAAARALLRAALDANAGDGRTWSALGFAELLDGRLPAARTAFARATVLMPLHVGTWHGLGWAALAQHDLPAARSAFDEALALDRNAAESHGGAAVVRVLSGEPDAARAAIARALGLDANALSARYAEALLAGDARSSDALLRLAHKLLGGKRTPFGGDVIDLLRPRAGAVSGRR